MKRPRPRIPAQSRIAAILGPARPVAASESFPAAQEALAAPEAPQEPNLAWRALSDQQPRYDPHVWVPPWEALRRALLRSENRWRDPLTAQRAILLELARLEAQRQAAIFERRRAAGRRTWLARQPGGPGASTISRSAALMGA